MYNFLKIYEGNSYTKLFSFGSSYTKTSFSFLQERYFVNFCLTLSKFVYSVRKAITGSFLLASFAGIKPPINVKITLTVIKIIA